MNYKGSETFRSVHGGGFPDIPGYLGLAGEIIKRVVKHKNTLCSE